MDIPKDAKDVFLGIVEGEQYRADGKGFDRFADKTYWFLYGEHPLFDHCTRESFLASDAVTGRFREAEPVDAAVDNVVEPAAAETAEPSIDGVVEHANAGVAGGASDHPLEGVGEFLPFGGGPGDAGRFCIDAVDEPFRVGSLRPIHMFLMAWSFTYIHTYLLT